MNRELDYRSDYYSLGVTLLRAADRPAAVPADNALEWVHRHISQPPPAAQRRSIPAIPEPLSRIVAEADGQERRGPLPEHATA